MYSGILVFFDIFASHELAEKSQVWKKARR